MPSLRLLRLLLLPSLLVALPIKNVDVFEGVDFFTDVDVEKAVKEINGLSENAFHYLGLIMVLIALATALGSLVVCIMMGKIFTGINNFFTGAQDRMRKIFGRE